MPLSIIRVVVNIALRITFRVSKYIRNGDDDQMKSPSQPPFISIVSIDFLTFGTVFKMATATKIARNAIATQPTPKRNTLALHLFLFKMRKLA